MQQMINKDTLKVCTLRRHSSRAIWCRHFAVTQLYAAGSLTPLKRLIENGGSLPASKRVSSTHVRMWIDGVWVPLSTG